MKKILLAGLIALGAVSAQAGTITFDEFEQAGTGQTETLQHAEAGFFVEGTPLLAVHQQHESYAGSAAVHAPGPVSYASVYKQDLSGFTLNSIDIAPLMSTETINTSVTFVGRYIGGGEITQTFELTSAFQFSTFNFNGFTNMEQVYWIQDAAYLYQVDNIVVDEVAAIPEPGSLALLGLGLVGFAAARRKAVKA